MVLRVMHRGTFIKEVQSDEIFCESKSFAGAKIRRNIFTLFRSDLSHKCFKFLKKFSILLRQENCVAL